MYDTKPKQRGRGRFYQVERVISRRKVLHENEYLIKWFGWPLESCSWEPSSNLRFELLRNYAFPNNISDQRLQEASRVFASRILSALKSSSSSSIYINMDLDIWRYVTFDKGTPSNHLFERGDLARLKYPPSHWYYFFNSNGEGCAIDFPIKVNPVLSWTPSHFVKNNGKLSAAPWFPMEKIHVTIVKKACNIQNI